jgi:Ni/Co efflux regulator RcnB
MNRTRLLMVSLLAVSFLPTSAFASGQSVFSGSHNHTDREQEHDRDSHHDNDRDSHHDDRDSHHDQDRNSGSGHNCSGSGSTTTTTPPPPTVYK